MGVRLPPEYQETEWIEGTRNLHLIDTGIPGNKNTLAIEAKVKPGDYAQYVPLWGNYRGENYNVTRLIAYNTNSILSYINTKAGGGTSAVVIPPLFGTGKTFVIRQERTRLIIDGTAYTIPATATASENSGNIAINASTTGNPSSGTYTTQRWYYFRIFDGEIILRDFIPCYRKSDMIAGMYDLVSNAFFANARTDKTSEFTAGPDVIDSISPWMVARRRMLMRQYIGYEENKGFTGAYSNVSTGVVNGRFLTGFIPINGAKRVTCYYGGNITSGTMHYMVEYNGDKQYTNKDGYWDMKVKNQRTVTLYTSDVWYVRFSGFMNEIDQCYVKNADTGEILWKKGM